MKQTVGSRIREIAIAKALKAGMPAPTAMEIAESLGVRYESLRKWTTSATASNRNRAAKIAELLGVPVAAFMLGAEPVDDDDDMPEAPAYSAEALELAAIYDRVSEHDRKLIRALVLASESSAALPEEPMPPDDSPGVAPTPQPGPAR